MILPIARTAYRNWFACVTLLGMASMAFGELPTLELTAGLYRIETEVAASDANRRVGLMHRERLATNRGMLFVFPEVSAHCMWMKNTLIPLSVAFLDEDGKVINIADMTPHSLNSHCAGRPARFALEMNQGWFSGKGIGPGSRIGGVAKAPRPQ